jgi:hypothetical protein
MSGVELQLNEVSCPKSVSNESFSNGLQDYPFSVGRPSAWIPTQSYFRFRVELGKIAVANGSTTWNTPSFLTDKVAMAENVCACLYSNVQFKAGGQDVSSQMGYIAQASQSKMRLNKSRGWQKSVGKGCYMIESKFEERSKQVSLGPYSISGTSVVPVGTSETTVAITAATGIVVFANGEADPSESGVVVGDIIIVNGKPYSIGMVSGAGLTLSLGADAVEDDVVATLNWSIIKSDVSDESQGRNILYVMWQPPLSIFDHEGVLGAGDYKFTLTPNSLFNSHAIQSTDPNAVIGLADGNFNFRVHDVKFYAATVKMEIPSQIQTLKMLECQIDSKSVGTGGSSQSYQFTVPASTVNISVWLQSGEASGENILYPPTVFRTTDKSERSMKQFQITYSNVSKPNTLWSGDFKQEGSSLSNNLQQRYLDTFREAGMLENDGGIESFDSYLERGMMVHYSFMRDSEDKSTTVQLYLSTDTLPPNTRVFLCAWYQRLVEISTDNGSVIAVRGLNM